MLLAMLLGYIANFLVIYLPQGIGLFIDMFVMLLSFSSLEIELKSKWKNVVRIIMLFLTLGTTLSSIALITHTIETEHAHQEIVKKERENKRLKQVIDREISKQLDQRKDEINNRK